MLTRAAASLALALAFGALAPAAASADGGKCAPRLGRPPCTILRPVPAPGHRWVPYDAPECVLLVGGFGARHQDTAALFERALADLDPAAGRPFRRVVFGLERAELYPYDTYGPISESAASLRELMRDLADECFAIDLVAHSMGGLVADRALALYPSDADGVLAYLPLAAPHNGAFVARAAVFGLALDDTYAGLVSDLAGRLGTHDPGVAAARDLAVARAPQRAIRVPATVRQRMVTDLFVLRQDSVDARYEVREYLPRTLSEGHEGVVDDPVVRAVVAGTLRDHAVPDDPRSLVERKAASFASRLVDDTWSGLVGAAGLTAGVAAVNVGISSALIGAGAELAAGDAVGAAGRLSGGMYSIGARITGQVPEAAELGIPAIKLAIPLKLSLLMTAAAALLE